MQKRNSVRAALALGVVLGLGGVRAPSAAADSDNGQRLAQRWCASCHVISTAQRQANDAVAPFSAVAQVPQFDAQKLAFFLLDPHPKMPDMTLSRREAEDLAGYIMMQKP
jgi:mono/diheme cytochrome c family protein